MKWNWQSMCLHIYGEECADNEDQEHIIFRTSSEAQDSPLATNDSDGQVEITKNWQRPSGVFVVKHRPSSVLPLSIMGSFLP
jgi:hypothetical protein